MFRTFEPTSKDSSYGLNRIRLFVCLLLGRLTQSLPASLLLLAFRLCCCRRLSSRRFVFQLYDTRTHTHTHLGTSTPAVQCVVCIAPSRASNFTPPSDRLAAGSSTLLLACLLAHTLAVALSLYLSLSLTRSLTHSLSVEHFLLLSSSASCAPQSTSASSSKRQSRLFAQY